MDREFNDANQQKHFPLSHLLYIYEKSKPLSLYVNYMEGFKAWLEYLHPISIPETHTRIPHLLRSYELNQIAYFLKCHPEQVYHGYQTTLILLQQ